MRITWLAAALVACGPSSPPVATPAQPARAEGAATSSARAPNPYPATARRAVADHYGEVTVIDDYRWLEDPDDPSVLSWTAAQNELTRSRLDALPDRARIHARVSELLSTTAPEYLSVTVTGTTALALEKHPPRQQAMLIALRDPANPATERIVVDPNELDPSGKTAIDFFVPSRDGTRVGVSLSTGGSESGDLHVFDVATGKPLPDVIPRVNGGTAGGSIAWNASGTGFYYTRYPHPGERPTEDLAFYQQVYFHRLGAPIADDAYVMGKDLPRIAEIELHASPDGQAVLATVENGDGGEYAFYIIDGGGRTRGSSGIRTLSGSAADAFAVTQLFRFSDKVIFGKFGPDGTLYMVSRRGAPRGAVLRIARPYAPARADVIVPEGDGVIDDLAATASRLYLVELLGGPSRLRSFQLADGKATRPEVVATPFPVASIASPRPIGSDDLLYVTQSYTTTPGWYRYVARARRSEPTAMIQPMAFSMDDIEVVRETCKSADGTAVPLNILRKRGIALDGSHPALLYGYGGYSISLRPTLHRLTRMWIDQGGIYAEANLRGGNEFGEAWHEAGRLAAKQHVFDDFYACAKALVAAGYTRPDRLAIEGRSNGGLLMGAALVQHPEMYRAVVSGVGIYDMLRVELTTNGAFNVTEYGTVKDPALFRALYAYSPYHHVVDGVAYPAVLLTTGANDPRVDPYHSRKMTARLQAATSSARPILLRAASDTGHGMGSPLAAVIEEATDSYAFLMHELGVKFTE
ncbi:MAG TPA: prolyl oligopeptidase family serine peptidase [Kofleriaceae bacterium]|nr:prolyl oligopeptidase family serine peptidase [Kofleriaceae bacterium]